MLKLQTSPYPLGTCIQGNGGEKDFLIIFLWRGIWEVFVGGHLILAWEPDL
jgi:hypothetical protein